MVNNNVTIIGTAITNFYDCGVNGYENYGIRVEVEGFYGKSSVIELKYSGKTTVDKNKSYKGKVVVCSGFINTFITDDNKCFVTINGSELKVISNGVAPQKAEAGISEEEMNLPF